MENQTPNPGNINQEFAQQFGQQQIPNATGILVLGIVSIPVCFCYFFFGIPGLITSIISLVLYNKAKKLYDENPSLYTQSSFNNMKAGRICAIIGLCLNALCLIGMIIYIVFIVSLVGGAMTSFPWR